MTMASASAMASGLAKTSQTERHSRIELSGRGKLLLVDFSSPYLPYLKNAELVFDPWIAEWQIVQF